MNTMINYCSVVEVLRSDKYVDRTDFFEHFIDRNFITLSNCSGTGSSLFLKTFACFLNEAIDTKDIFNRLKIGHNNVLIQKANSYRVIYLDFSDFQADNYERAISYVTEKMKQTYRCYWNYFADEINHYYGYQPYENAIDVIEGTPSESVLQKSLWSLILQLRGYESSSNRKKLAVLIDNMALLETVARNNGYSKEMENFLKQFIVDDVYKYCDLFLQISDVEESEHFWPSNDQYLTHRYFSVFPVDQKKRYPGLAVPKEHQCVFPFAPSVTDITNWKSIVNDGRKKIKKAREEEERRHLDYISREKERYAIDLSPNIPLLSPNLGIRTKKLDKKSQAYIKLNNLLKGLYEKSCSLFKREHVYNHLQKRNDSECIVRYKKNIIDTIKVLSDQNPSWKKVWVDSSWGEWIQVVCTRADDESGRTAARPENLKVYAFLKNQNIENVFVDSVNYLLEHAKKNFAAKLAVYSRSDQMCYWITTNDYQYLEEFFLPYYDSMEMSMPFMAYKGKMGISKDFPGADSSHNSMLAQIIFDYFQSVTDVTHIDLEDMFNLYISKWNDDIVEENDFGGFKNSSALSFVVILDSLDAILGERPLDDKAFLLTGDGKVWKTLADSKCWADINEKWNKCYPRTDLKFNIDTRAPEEWAIAE